jgi:copper chaperone CopZ
MKNLMIRFGVALIITLTSGSLWAQKNKVETISFKVYGNCGMCKSRMETALDTKGIKSAEWNIQTKEMVVTYVPAKISEIKIHELIASVGHDTDKKQAVDSVYKELPSCCLYRENPNTHTD